MDWHFRLEFGAGIQAAVVESSVMGWGLGARSKSPAQTGSFEVSLDLIWGELEF